MIIYNGNELLITNTLLYFYANWMPQHKRMMKVISNLSELGYNVIVVDTDSFKDFTKANGISCVPTFVFYKNKKRVKTIEGLQMSSVINNEIYNIYLKEPREKN